MPPRPVARALFASFACFAACACLAPLARADAPLVLVPTPALGGQCDDLDTRALADAIEAERPLVRKLPPTAALRLGDRSIAPADYADHTLAPLAEAARKGPAALCDALATRFQFFRNAGAGTGKFTAYYNPLFRGSRTRGGAFQFPLYRRPPAPLDQLATADVLAGALDNKGLELLWLADPTEALAAHVEGSATIVLPDGAVMNVGANGHNGRPYQNVSKLLADSGRIPREQRTPLGMTRARKYFIDHPGELAAYWAKNPHFVFFKETSHKGGGRFGELVPGRSLAVDPRAVPLGAATWIRTDKPAIADDKVQRWVSFGRVALAEDTGAGIGGPGRVDVFFGTGEYAMQAAAVTTRPGELYVLLAK